VSDYAGIALIITAIFGGLTSLGTILTAYLANRAATKTKEVKEALEKSDRSRDGKLDAIHVLVNNNMQVQLQVAATALRELATTTGIAAHVRAAEQAEQALADHKQKQAVVDAVEQTQET